MVFLMALSCCVAWIALPCMGIFWHGDPFPARLLQAVILLQPVTSLAFVFDGLHYGASDFSYAAKAMVRPQGRTLAPQRRAQRLPPPCTGTGGR